MEPTPSTFHSIQLLRALAAFLVVLFHTHTAFTEAGSGLLFGDEAYMFAFGAVGVHIFFVISGFIMVVTSRFEPSFQRFEFMRRRLLRIYPVYWICAALYLAYHSFIGEPYDISGAQIAGALLLWPGHASSIIGPAWTLAYEMFFYLCFALTMSLGLTRGFMVLASTFAALIVLGIFFDPSASAWRLATNSLLAEFVGGMAIGWLLKRNMLPKWGGGHWIALAITLYLLGAWYGFSRLPSAVIWGAPSVLLVLGAVCWELQHGAGKATRLVGILGDSSYSLYLVHILLITIALEIWKGVPPIIGNNALAITAIISGVCMIAAELFHRGVERPLLRRLNPRRSRLPSHRSAQAN